MYSASELLCEQPHVFTYTTAVPGTNGDDEEEEVTNDLRGEARHLNTWHWICNLAVDSL